MIVEPSTLALFLVAVLALFVTPGPNMVFVLSYSLAHGPRAGFAAALQRNPWVSRVQGWFLGTVLAGLALRLLLLERPVRQDG